MQTIIGREHTPKGHKEAASFILNHDYWLPLLRDRQAYFRDLVLSLVVTTTKRGLDDRAMAETLQHLIDNGYLWVALNKIKTPSIIVFALDIAACSLRRVDVAPEPENMQRVLSMLIEPEIRPGWNPLVHRGDGAGMVGVLPDEESYVDPEVVRLILDDASAVAKLANIVDNGIKDPAQAIAILKHGIQPALVDGAL
jgi:hypothetical protein